MPIYYMFLLFLLFVVLSILSFRDSYVKEGLDAQENASKIYDNYNIISRTFDEYNARFKSLVI